MIIDYKSIAGKNQETLLDKIKENINRNKLIYTPIIAVSLLVPVVNKVDNQIVEPYITQATELLKEARKLDKEGNEYDAFFKVDNALEILAEGKRKNPPDIYNSGRAKLNKLEKQLEEYKAELEPQVDKAKYF